MNIQLSHSRFLLSTKNTFSVKVDDDIRTVATTIITFVCIELKSAEIMAPKIGVQNETSSFVYRCVHLTGTSNDNAALEWIIQRRQHQRKSMLDQCTTQSAVCHVLCAVCSVLFALYKVQQQPNLLSARYWSVCDKLVGVQNAPLLCEAAIVVMARHCRL